MSSAVGEILVSMLKRTSVSPLDATRSKTSCSVGIFSPGLATQPGWPAKSPLEPQSSVRICANVSWLIGWPSSAASPVQWFGLIVRSCATTTTPSFGHARVELERVDVAREAVGERGERVLRAVAAAAAVRLDVERRRDRVRQIQALGVHDLAQAVRVVGDDAVHVALDQRLHVGLLVDRPRDHGQPAVVRGLDQAVGGVGVQRGEDVGLQLVRDGQRERAVTERVGADLDAGGPRRALEDRRLLRERDAAQAGGDAARLDQRAPVEGLDQRALGHAVLLDRRR